MKKILIDTNIILRYLLRDNEKLFKVANAYFEDAERGNSILYVDELVIAEALWTLTSFYKQDKKEVQDILLKLISRNWVINPRKKLILAALKLCGSSNLSYVDSWIFEVSKSDKLELATLDKDLAKQF